MRKIYIDFETYSECDLRAKGTWMYSIHPSTRIQLIGYAVDDGEVYCEPITDALMEYLTEDPDTTFHSWNVFFEYCLWKHSNNTRKFNNTPQPHQWRDIMAKAAVAALPMQLKDCAIHLDVPKEYRKDSKGERLIQKLCVPNKAKGTIKEYQDLASYCKQDVKAMRYIDQQLKDLSIEEQIIWEQYLDMNVRGIPFDRKFIDNACHLIEENNKCLDEEIYRLSKGKINSGTEVGKIKEFLGVKSLVKENFKENAKNLDANQMRILEIRSERGRTSNAKYGAILSTLDSDNRIHGALQHHGASTGRGVGRMFQPYNLPRKSVKEDILEFLRTEDLDYFQMIGLDPTKLLSDSLRQAILAPEGKAFTVGDFSSIETIGTAWLAGDQKTLDVFKGDGKIYELAASQIYGIPKDKVSEQQRQVGKVATLALGYQGGPKAFDRMAAAYGVSLPENEVKDIVTKWRASHSEIVKLWKSLDNAALKAVQNPTQAVNCGVVSFKTQGKFLYCKLPSGRLLSYYKPKLIKNEFDTFQVAYMGYSSFKGAKVWCEQPMYGGKWLENICQAWSRDLLTAAMIRLEEKGYKVILEVYDEIVCETEKNFGSLDEMLKIMCEQPDWAKGREIPLSAKGFRDVRYRK